MHTTMHPCLLIKDRRSARHTAKKAGRYMVAIMNEALELKHGQTVLEIGAGSGYHAAVIAEQVAPDGRVYTVERISELVALARRNLERAGYGDRVIIVQGDGSLGYGDRSPYDRILVTAAAPKVPAALKDQLKSNGILLVPVGGRLVPQELVKVQKDSEGEFKPASLGGVAFVPLIGDQGFES